MDGYERVTGTDKICIFHGQNEAKSGIWGRRE